MGACPARPRCWAPGTGRPRNRGSPSAHLACGMEGPGWTGALFLEAFTGGPGQAWHSSQTPWQSADIPVSLQCDTPQPARPAPDTENRSSQSIDSFLWTRADGLGAWSLPPRGPRASAVARRGQTHTPASATQLAPPATPTPVPWLALRPDQGARQAAEARGGKVPFKPPSHLQWTPKRRMVKVNSRSELEGVFTFPGFHGSLLLLEKITGFSFFKVHQRNDA